MADSVGEQVMQAIVAALNAAPAKPCTTERAPLDPAVEAQMPRIALYALTEDIQDESQNVTKFTRTIRLELAAASATPADAPLDELYVFAVKTLMATDLSALIRNIGPVKAQWETEQSFQDVAMAFLDWQVVYYTNSSDPTEVYQ